MYAEAHPPGLQRQQIVKVCGGRAGFLKCEKKKALMHDITHTKAHKLEPSLGRTSHRFVINFKSRHVNPQVTNDFVLFRTPKTHTHVYIDTWDFVSM